ncbi:ADP-ribosylglycohydrolase family protein [Nocardia tengchongensis]|uniref:ADP-ribosylglycohydrolase family protein n=1 Tax=Nocardia tengchongensis TaxID=2055889 RepID=UPI003656CC3D
MTLTAAQRDRAQGVLLGTAAGDALGAGYEFTFPTATTAIAMNGGGTFQWAPGEWTDDTSMAIAIAIAAAEVGDLHSVAGQDAVAAGFVRWWDTRPKDVGRQTSAVLARRSSTAKAMRAVASTLIRRGGNGSLMRTAPVALASLNDIDVTVAAAIAISSLTHNDQRANEACVLWTLAIRHAVLHGNYAGLRAALPYVDAEYWEPLLDQAEQTDQPRESFGKNGWCVDALLSAWWAITHTDSLPAALEAAVRIGGDADTVAAITGGLVGARWGASAVPTHWRDRVHGYPGLRANDLTELTDRIIATS